MLQTSSSNQLVAEVYVYVAMLSPVATLFASTVPDAEQFRCMSPLPLAPSWNSWLRPRGMLGGGANRATRRRAALTLGFLSADVPGLVALSLSVVVPLVRPVVYVSALLEALDTVLLETETAAEVLLVPLALSGAGFVPKRNYSFSVRCLHEQSTPLPAAWLSSSTLQPCCAAGAAGSAGFGADEEEGAAGGAAGATGTSSRAAGGPSDAAPPARGAAAGEAEG